MVCNPLISDPFAFPRRPSNRAGLPRIAYRIGCYADFVEVISRRGKVMAQARVTEEIVQGTCFLPFHWGRDEGFFKAANNLTISARDPLSRQPELKACAVRVRKVTDFPLEDN